ncbi:sensor histidine kinase [Hymenobacter sp. BT491]|uniref:sensor histidine kinase n=1 Tax=Hymenobacter sp. BT491 TaxID=2766779 RepID=UPI001653983A|nr:sensor histidine kinase [Hymenobacter sp. BT491]MBC6992328.1 sensor histidine kinase [Hymenobacter sp. BT491]
MIRAILLLLFALTTRLLRAEPLYPLLSPGAADSLRQQLWHTPPDTPRVDVLLRLCEDLVARYWGLGTPLDSAAAFGQQAAQLSQRLGYLRGKIKSQYALGNLALSLNQVAEGTRLLVQGLARSRQARDRRLEADGWYYRGLAYNFSAADIPRGIACLRRARALYHALGDEERATYTLKTIADQHATQGHLGLAQQELLQVLARYRALGQRRLHYTYDLLNVVNDKSGNFKEALRYAMAAVESAKATGDTTFLNLFYGRVGNIYSTLNQLDDAAAYYQLALHRAERTKQKNLADILGLTGLVAEVLIKQKQPQQALALALQKTKAYPVGGDVQIASWNMLTACYLANGQYAVAERCAQQIVRQLEGRSDLGGNVSMLRRAYTSLAQANLLTRRYEAAGRYLGKAGALPVKSSVISQATTEQLWFKVDSAQGHYRTAIGHQQRYLVLHDSVFNERKSKQIASLQIQYDTRKKAQDLALLTKQNMVQRANIRQREIQRNSLLAGVLMLALVLGLGYNRYRLKQRNTRLLEAKQEEISSQNTFLEEVLTEKNGLLEEKEWMLKEIHHRVKNNLQIIGSLLRSQAVYVQDGAARAAVRESRNRVHSMALIHQQLYQSNRLTGVPMDAYIQEIVAHLLASFDCQEAVRVALTVAAVELDVAQAVPVGLILNEAITNALKYAFPDGRSGTLTIAFEMLPANRCRLTVGDDGVGYAPDFEPAHSHTLGLSLIQGLSKQIDGFLQVEGGPGVHISLEFNHLALQPHH